MLQEEDGGDMREESGDKVMSAYLANFHTSQLLSHPCWMFERETLLVLTSSTNRPIPVLHSGVANIKPQRIETSELILFARRQPFDARVFYNGEDYGKF